MAGKMRRCRECVDCGNGGWLDGGKDLVWQLVFLALSN